MREAISNTDFVDNPIVEPHAPHTLCGAFFMAVYCLALTTIGTAIAVDAHTQLPKSVPELIAFRFSLERFS